MKKADGLYDKIFFALTKFFEFCLNTGFATSSSKQLLNVLVSFSTGK